MDYLQLNSHSRDILELLEQHNLNERSFNVNDYRVVCVDMNLPGHGDVVGSSDARQTLCICRQNMNHFVPLLRLRSADGFMACKVPKRKLVYSSPSVPPGLACSASSSHASLSAAHVASNVAAASSTNSAENNESPGGLFSSRCAQVLFCNVEALVCS